MIAEMQNFTVGKVEGKSANFEIADSDEDSKKNLPLFNPFYHYAFDVYGTNTMRDLKSIPFHKMGKALDEIHNNVGPWLIPYEPPNVGPAQVILRIFCRIFLSKKPGRFYDYLFTNRR